MVLKNLLQLKKYRNSSQEAVANIKCHYFKRQRQINKIVKKTDIITLK